MLKNVLTLCFFLIFSAGLKSQVDSVGMLLTSASSTQPDSTSKSKLPNAGDVFKPTIGLGVGMLNFYGDLYSRHFQMPNVGRVGYELNLWQPLSKSLYLNFYAMFGKLGANEYRGFRNENFQAEIRMGGIQLMYDFAHLIPKHHTVRPYIMTGIQSFEFLSKTDLFDKYGNRYYYWSDGSIKNLPENDPNAANAINLVRDYTYESDIRELNKDGFGKYQERSWAVPLGGGFIFDIGERVKVKIGTTFHFAFTDYIDGITNKSVGSRNGTKAKDNFMMSSFSLHYDLIMKRKGDTLPEDHFDNVDYLVLNDSDEDGDGVNDWDDKCHKTPKGVKVDAHGCPVDEDKDLVQDYIDQELPTPSSLIANGEGIGITDEMAQDWYDRYHDSIGIGPIVDLDSSKKKGKFVDPLRTKREYTVEIARFQGGVPPDIMAYLLSIGDVNSLELGDTTVVYVAGRYEDIRMAIKRKDEFVSEGAKEATVGYFKGDNYFRLTTSELAEALSKANAQSAFDTSSTKSNSATAGFAPHQVVYRVQLGAYKHKMSPAMFKTAGQVLELPMENGGYRYVSGAYTSLSAAAVHRAELVLEGYPDAFVTAYRDGKRISLKDAGATYENKSFKEDLNENANTGSAVDKSLVSFRIQIGQLKKPGDTSYEEKIKDLKGVEKQTTETGYIRVMVGKYQNYNEAVKIKQKLNDEGYSDAFVIALFKGQLISIQEAIELLK